VSGLRIEAELTEHGDAVIKADLLGDESVSHLPTTALFCSVDMDRPFLALSACRARPTGAPCRRAKGPSRETAAANFQRSPTRPDGVPYLLGRPARVWIDAMSRRSPARQSRQVPCLFSDKSGNQLRNYDLVSNATYIGASSRI
jgi:hypothetical protein